MTHMLTLTNVESTYGPVRALRGVSLEVPEGQIVTVLGSNGAGKTTILKTVSGIIDPRKGHIHFSDASFCICDEKSVAPRLKLVVTAMLMP